MNSSSPVSTGGLLFCRTTAFFTEGTEKACDNLFPRDKASVRQGIGIPFQPQQTPAHTPTTRCSIGASIADVRHSTTMPGLMCQGRLRTSTRLCAGQAGTILPVCRQYACSPVSRFRQTHRFLQAYAFLTLLLKRDNAPCSPSPSPVPAQPMCRPGCAELVHKRFRSCVQIDIRRGGSSLLCNPLSEISSHGFFLP